MPKDTFFNLPEEKRELICQVAIDEFAAHSFDQASINRIVARSGIAKGSFYQYFENKKDLFLYLLQMVSDEKLNYLAPVLSNPEQHDFFTLLQELYRAGIRFAIEHPEYSEIGKRLLVSRESAIYSDAVEQAMPSGVSFFETLLENAIANGQVRADIDVKMLAYLVISMNAILVEYYVDHVGAEYDEKMMETLDRFLDFLRHGMAERSSVELSK